MGKQPTACLHLEPSRRWRTRVPGALTTVWVRSMRASTVFFRYLSFAAASVKRNISELAGALAKANFEDEDEEGC